MKTIRILALVLASTVLAAGLCAQTPPHFHVHTGEAPVTTGKQAKPKPGKTDDKMMASCMEMMQKQHRSQADFTAMDARMDALLAKLNVAEGADRRQAMTVLITELIVQHRAERNTTASMQSDMMKHMMQHMQTGKQSISTCPMMTGMHMEKTNSGKSEDHPKYH